MYLIQLKKNSDLTELQWMPWDDVLFSVTDISSVGEKKILEIGCKLIGCCLDATCNRTRYLSENILRKC